MSAFNHHERSTGAALCLADCLLAQLWVGNGLSDVAALIDSSVAVPALDS